MGFVRVIPQGVEITLMISKASQDKAVACARLSIAEGEAKEKAAAMMKSFSGHSMRSGFVTSP